MTASTANSGLANNTYETVDFDSETTDTHSAVTTGASWAFVAPRAGKYLLTSKIQMAASTAWGTTEILVWKWRNNTSDGRSVALYPDPSASGSSIAASIEGTFHLNLSSGDSIDLQARQNTGGALNFSQSADCHVTIAEVQ
jgi:hypothetical protein